MSNKLTQRTVRIKDEDYKRFMEICEQEGESGSSIMRKLIKEYIKKYDNQLGN